MGRPMASQAFCHASVGRIILASSPCLGCCFFSWTDWLRKLADEAAAPLANEMAAPLFSAILQRLLSGLVADCWLTVDELPAWSSAENLTRGLDCLANAREVRSEPVLSQPSSQATSLPTSQSSSQPVAVNLSALSPQASQLVRPQATVQPVWQQSTNQLSRNSCQPNSQTALSAKPSARELVSSQPNLAFLPASYRPPASRIKNQKLPLCCQIQPACSQLCLLLC